MRRPLLALAAFALATAPAAAAPIIDQQNTAGGLGSNGSTGIGQSFTPSLPGIDFATFSLNTFGVAEVFRLDLYAGDGFAGPLLASTPLTPFASTSFQPLQLDFATTVALTPGACTLSAPCSSPAARRTAPSSRSRTPTAGA